MKARIHHSGGRCGSEIARRGGNLCGRHVAHRLGPLRRPNSSRLRQLIKARCIAGYELVVIQFLGNQDMGNAQQQGQIASGTHTQPAVGKRGRATAPGVNHDDLRPTATGIVERINGPHRRRIDNGTPQIHDAIGMCQVGGGAVA